MEHIGPRVRALRRARNPRMTLTDLAGDVLTPGYLSKLERGLVGASPQTLQYLAERLGVGLAALFDERPGPRPVDLLRAEALLGLARVAEKHGAASTAYKLYQQVLGELNQGEGSPLERYREATDATVQRSVRLDRRT